jgi:hypothetical protein
MSSCNFNYKGKTYSEQDVKPIVSYHYLVEETLLNTDQFDKGIDITVKEADDSLEKANNIIDQVNSKLGLGAKIVSLNDSVVDIDVNPIAGSILSKAKEGYVGINPELNEETTQRKNYNLEGVEPEVMDDYEAKATLMEQRFNELGITSHIIMDGDLNASGELLGTGTPRYKELVADGSINDGDAVIVVNPRLLFSDTVFHEYGHIFIDMLGGMNNPRIKYAYSKIQNSKLASQVREQYPELQGDALAKEIMATALGKEATEIFETGNPDVGFIQRFINWVRDSIRGLLGLQTTTIKDLANELLGNQNLDKQQFTGGLNTTSQLMKASQAKREARRTRIINNAEQTVQKLKTRLNNTIAQVNNSLDPIKKDFKTKAIEINEQLKNLSKNSNLAAIDGYLTQLEDIGTKINDGLEALQEQVNQGKKPNVSFELLNQIDLYNSIFTFVNDVNNSVTSGYFESEFKEEGWSSDDTKAFKDLVAKVKKLHDDIKNKHVSIGRVYLSYKLADYSNRQVIERRLELDSQFKESNPRQSDESLKDYNKRIRELTNAEIAKELPQLKKDEQLAILEKLQSAPADIAEIGMWMSSEKDLNSTVIQLASKLLDDADLMRDQKMLAKKMQAFEVFKKFDKETGGTSAKEKYKGFYKEGSDGKLYITTEYNPEWYIQRKELLNNWLSLSDADKLEEAAEAKKKLDDWDKVNTIKYQDGIQYKKKPADKWLDPDYKAIMANPDSGKAQMLKFLTDTSIENSKLLHGNLSLVRQVNDSEQIFILAPSIGKSFFEKTVDGNYIKNAKDSFQRIYQTKADDTDLVGDTTNLDRQKLGLKVLADAEGNMKHGVPIHFRGAIDRETQSYDLMSSLIMDHYMAQNYHHKSGLQIELELMKEVISQKKFDQTIGNRKIPAYNALNKNEDEPLEPILGKNSKELKALTSIIDNRLYGIKNANTEYAKLVGSVMSWTSSTMLMFNVPSAVTNALQGSLYNFIEAHSSQYFNKGNLKNATKHLMTDLPRSLDDAGRPVQTSKTNVLMQFFNIQGEFKSISNKFIENNRFKALAKSSTGYALSHMGEFMMHGNLMYAILDNIKAMNKDNKFVDKDGNVVPENKAMTLAEAISVDAKGNMSINPNMYKTNYGNSRLSLDTKKDKGLLEVKQLINKIAHDLHGNYNEEIQNMAQRYAMGKLFFMLRKWMVPGFNKRWRGANRIWANKDDLREDVDMFYSEDLQSFQEGYYTTGLRFLRNLLRDISTLGVSLAGKQNLEQLSDYELANLRRFAIEVGTLLTTLAIAYLLKGLAEAEDDPLEREVLFHLTYYIRRIYSETQFYSNPMEAFKIASSPAASFSYFGKLYKFGEQVLTDTYGVTFGDGMEIYERGKFKGDPKLWKRTNDLLPGINQYYRDIEESTSWLFNLY